MHYLIEAAQLDMLYNQSNNQMKACAQQCNNNVTTDANVQYKIRLCRAQCKVKFDQLYLKSLYKVYQSRESIANQEYQGVVQNKIRLATTQLNQSMKRLIYVKDQLKQLTSRIPADMSTRPATPSPAFETSKG